MDMASEIWSKTADLIETLKREPQRFSFSQAVRLSLLKLGKGEHSPASLSNIFIRPWLSLAFPASDITEVRDNETDKNGHISITATCLGLYSTMGPLPTFYTEELLEESRRDESVTRNFLDILNNHIYHLYYDAERHNLLELSTVESCQDMYAHMQFSIIGLGIPALRETDFSYFKLAPCFIFGARSSSLLKLYIRTLLQREDVNIEECVERVVPVPKDQRCLLGRRNTMLGEEAVLGSVVHDCTGKIRLTFSSVSDEDMPRFLYGGDIYNTLKVGLQLYLRSPLEYELVMYPSDKNTAPHILGKNTTCGFYLGTGKNKRTVTGFANFDNDKRHYR